MLVLTHFWLLPPKTAAVQFFSAAIAQHKLWLIQGRALLKLHDDFSLFRISLWLDGVSFKDLRNIFVCTLETWAEECAFVFETNMYTHVYI